MTPAPMELQVEWAVKWYWKEQDIGERTLLEKGVNLHLTVNTEWLPVAHSYVIYSWL